MKTPRTGLAILALGLGLGGVVGAGAVLAVGARADRPMAAAVAPAPPAPSLSAGTAEDPPELLAQRTTAVVRAVEGARDAVVSVTTEVPLQDPFARMWAGPTTSGQGSGVVIDPDGVVLTNAHVVEGASRITCSFADDTRVEADVVGIARDLDLAVLRLQRDPGAAPLHAIDVGRSAALMLGEPVIAIGNPFGLGHTVTTGVVSSTSRSLETDERVYQDFIQTDASINPGNSGGPLLDIAGRLVGINTAIREDANGIGFAIPSDRALKVAQDLVAFGAVQIPWLGVDLSDVMTTEGGARRVAARVDAVHAGDALVAGDIILAVGDRQVQGRGDLNAYLAGVPPQSTVALRVQRGREAQTVRVATSKLPDEVVSTAMSRTLGLDPAELSPVRVRGTPGLQISSLPPGSALARLGLAPGDVLLSLNGQSLASVAALRAALADAKSGHRGTALLTIVRGHRVVRATVAI